MANQLAPKAKQEVAEPESTRPGRYYVPEVDIFEDEHALWLWADMPGVDQERVHVELDKDLLTLRGEVTLDDYRGLTPVYTEYNVGHYFRRFGMRDAATFDRDRISARMVNGVLELQLPKAEPAKPRRIPVSAG
jgi:HSP20 family protein